MTLNWLKYLSAANRQRIYCKNINAPNSVSLALSCLLLLSGMFHGFFFPLLPSDGFSVCSPAAQLTTITHWWWWWWWCCAYWMNFCAGITFIGYRLISMRSHDSMVYNSSVLQLITMWIIVEHTHTQPHSTHRERERAREWTKNDKHAVQSMMYYSVSFGYTFQVYFVD